MKNKFEEKINELSCKLLSDEKFQKIMNKFCVKHEKEIKGSVENGKQGNN